MSVHGATVEEVIDDEGERAFRAVCLETGAVCDAWAFPGADSLIWPVPADQRDGAAIERALKFLGDATLHEWNSPHACIDARHVMEHDRP